MKLRFYARADGLVALPNDRLIIGSPARYVGRDFDPATRSHPATKEAHECESDAPEATTLARACRKGGLWAADEATAAACGTAYTPVSYEGGEWAAKKSKASNASAQSAS